MPVRSLTSSVLAWPDAGAVDHAVRRWAERIVATRSGVRRIGYFGSYARGRRDLFTDLDLFVAWKTERPVLDRLRFLYSILDVRVDLDIVCYTPAELQARSDQPFIRQLLSEEVVLYERQPG